MSEVEMTTPTATEDARALLARLYREIGTSAVAAALQLRDAPEPERKAVPTLATPSRGDEIAA